MQQKPVAWRHITDLSLSALGQLEFYPPVTAIGDLVVSRVQWLKLAESGRDKPLGRDPECAKLFHDRDGAG